MDEHVDKLAGERPGKVTIDPGVLVTIARLTALSIPGVCRMAQRTPPRLLATGSTGEGTRIVVIDHAVTVDLYVIVHSGVNMLETGRAVQAEVTRAILDMVGMEVREVNVHIDDVEFPAVAPALQE
ncbi:MAG: Asp23/Gls24 family envelope stress response protein [Anaerolineae bacterium]|nr:Asp23/Gls24 family envelope stress response protein [Anaerolineae bacterium]